MSNSNRIEHANPPVVTAIHVTVGIINRNITVVKSTEAHNRHRSTIGKYGHRPVFIVIGRFDVVKLFSRKT